MEDSFEQLRVRGGYHVGLSTSSRLKGSDRSETTRATFKVAFPPLSLLPSPRHVPFDVSCSHQRVHSPSIHQYRRRDGRPFFLRFVLLLRHHHLSISRESSLRTGGTRRSDVDALEDLVDSFGRRTSLSLLFFLLFSLTFFFSPPPLAIDLLYTLLSPRHRSLHSFGFPTVPTNSSALHLPPLPSIPRHPPFLPRRPPPPTSSQIYRRQSQGSQAPPGRPARFPRRDSGRVVSDFLQQGNSRSEALHDLACEVRTCRAFLRSSRSCFWRPVQRKVDTDFHSSILLLLFCLQTVSLIILQIIFGALVVYAPALLGGEGRAKALWKYHRFVLSSIPSSSVSCLPF